MKIDAQGVLNTFRGKAADELTRLREENDTLVQERDRLRMQLESAQMDLENHASALEACHEHIAELKQDVIAIQSKCKCVEIVKAVRNCYTKRSPYWEGADYALRCLTRPHPERDQCKCENCAKAREKYNK